MWPPEYLNALWAQGGTIAAVQNDDGSLRFELTSSGEQQTEDLTAQIDFTKSDVWVAGNLILFLVIGMSNAQPLLLSGGSGGVGAMFKEAPRLVWERQRSNGLCLILIELSIQIGPITF